MFQGSCRSWGVFHSVPNDFAYFALLIWPLVSVIIYHTVPIIPATFWTIVGGYLLLPVGTEFDFPLLPALDKQSIPAIMAFIGCKFIARKKITLLPTAGFERKLIILFFVGSAITVFTNGDPVIEPNRYIPGLSLHDLLATVVSQWLLLIPFIIGTQIIETHDDQVQVLRLLVIAGLWYSLLIVFEIRMSPQLHNLVYGFFPHSWIQQLRYGGFRPVVFLGHGLWVSIFIFTVLGSIIALSRLKLQSFKFSDSLIISGFVVLIILAKGVGAILLGLSVYIIVMFFKHESVAKIALFLSVIAILYPIFCIVNLFPHDYLLDLIGSIDSSRAASLRFRFDQEIALLNRAVQKIFFGWGAWGRNRLEDSVTDGYWVILVGKYGLIGFSAIFGLILRAIWRTNTAEKLIDKINERQFITTIMLVLTFLLIDQIPNASVNPIMWFLVGAQLGRCNAIINTKDTVLASNAFGKPLSKQVRSSHNEKMLSTKELM